ncbi:polysaccharide pyruvyl transferase family protein [Methanobrevibacter arboriphilus]|uniref:polysaccharide pyruvyl transferase family protein n=1 Tax=Methanobrevibacter arboriphilus TaxID=39441 RepID=UPI0005B27B63|nr:polysaccharide pyruvyl transferase family protein [Methanobrevibacter arboriphilus]
MTWEERAKNVEERLKIYQNAKCVVTIRLHATLPCLAMGVPVLWVLKSPNWGRFNPYRKWVRVVSPNDIIKNNHDFDFVDPSPNSGDHLKTRKKMIKRIKKFIKENKDKNTIEDIKKTNFTEEERKEFQFNLMKTALDKWLRPSMDMVNEIENLKSE